MQRLLRAGCALVIAVAASLARADGDPRIPIGVLGDSNAHSYQDPIGIGPPPRGGAFHDRTFQWTELLARLRGDEVDLGPWETAGSRNGARLAKLLGKLGLPGPRAPYKQDYRHNFAYSGAQCRDLVQPPQDQSRWLAAEIGRDPARWARGAVIVTAGINTLGQEPELLRYARGGGQDAETAAAIAGCVEAMAEAVARLRAVQPQLAVLLVSNADDNVLPSIPRPEWAAPAARARVGAVLGRWESALRQRFAGDARTAVLDDRSWYAAHFIRYDTQGRSLPQSIPFAGGRPLVNDAGDEPFHLFVADTHAGTALNALWLERTLATLDGRLGVRITPIPRVEVARLADPAGRFGLLPAGAAKP